MARRDLGSATRVLLVLAATGLTVLPIVHAGQSTSCVQHDDLGRVVSKGGILTTCAAQGKTCGTIPDGCGGTLNCGACTSPSICTASNTCCTPAACAGRCGALPDGCGGTLSCGGCPTGQVCTTANACCTPTTCAAVGAQCGSVSDGCGGTLNCGTCSSGSCSANRCPGACTAECDLIDCFKVITNACSTGFTPVTDLRCVTNIHGACVQSGGSCTCQ